MMVPVKTMCIFVVESPESFFEVTVIRSEAEPLVFKTGPYPHQGNSPVILRMLSTVAHNINSHMNRAKDGHEYPAR